MLDGLEIKRLEKLLSNYRKKLFIKLGIIASLCACAIVVITVILPRGYDSSKEAQIAKNELQQRLKIQNLKQKAIDEKYNNYDDDELEKPKQKNTAKSKQNNKSKDKDEMVFLENEPKFSAKEKEVKKEKKAQVIIESTALNTSIDTLKENFYKTHDIQYVRLLAKEYYDKKDYKNAAKWALTLNDMDKNDPDGWIIFAKSQAKMNKRQDAIRVLETFQNKAPDNQEIQAIISQIYSNTLP